jgi:hypothetical protein
MQHLCTYSSPWFYASSFDSRMPRYTLEYGGGKYHSCLTNYNILSGASGPVVMPTRRCLFSGYGHNCNDDSKTQLRYVKGEKPGCAQTTATTLMDASNARIATSR